MAATVAAWNLPVRLTPVARVAQQPVAREWGLPHHTRD